jgi:hypothetical protein
VRGISYQKVATDGSDRVLSHQVEFNSLLWAENLGFEINFPTEGEYAEGGGDGEAPPTKRSVGYGFIA